ncbi:hypothetical protein G6F24_017411 [Rhizopus arrhizus]|nr:hypothetical protein G6F24_017411 [Rhizopus arrhizus]
MSYWPSAGSAPRCASIVGATSAALGSAYQLLSQTPSNDASSAVPPSIAGWFGASMMVLLDDSGRPSTVPVLPRPWLVATTISQFSLGFAARRSAICLARPPPAASVWRITAW